MLIPVLLSGGTGSRLWPLSRTLYPKQFLPLTNEYSLFENSLLRAATLPDSQAPIVVCNQEHRFIVAEQLRQAAITASAIILEPCAKNTAPATAAAALQAIKTHPEALLLVMPSDHILIEPAALSDAVQAGLTKAEQDFLVTFGIIPKTVETGYGYIQRQPNTDGASQTCSPIQAFIEKPDYESAQRYVADGNYLWNSGIFLFKAQAFIDALHQFAPAILKAVEAAFNAAQQDLDFIRLDIPSFIQSPSDSIDYAVMEKTNKGMVVPLAGPWSDVGSWSALWDIGSQDENGNVSCGDVILEDTQNSYVHSDSRLVTTLGINNVVVVETADAVLVADKQKSQAVKKIVAQLKAQKRYEADSHTTVYRPWGSYESLVVGKRFQVKRIIVKPGQSLSLQMHHHRAEHWVVVSGTAKVVCGDKNAVLTEDQSIYIPIGHQHRLENPGIIPLELIEVQSGSYLGEDDIVRFDDRYGRQR